MCTQKSLGSSPSGPFAAGASKLHTRDDATVDRIFYKTILGRSDVTTSFPLIALMAS